jgi:hypothetical protein
MRPTVAVVLRSPGSAQRHPKSSTEHRRVVSDEVDSKPAGLIRVTVTVSGGENLSVTHTSNPFYPSRDG